jgi:hypothetical protein
MSKTTTFLNWVDPLLFLRNNKAINKITDTGRLTISAIRVAGKTDHAGREESVMLYSSHPVPNATLVRNHILIVKKIIFILLF